MFLWFAVPRALNQLEAAVGNAPTSGAQLKQAANHSTGIKHELLVGIEKRLKNLPAGTGLIHPALTVTRNAFEVLIGIVFVFASAAYWIFERDRAVDLVTSLIARPKRKKVRDTFDLIDAKLGAFVRGEVLLIAFVATIVSLAFWLIGEPYWLLLGIFAGVLEIVPVIGPMLAGGVAIGVGLTVSWHVALAAGLAVLIVRLLEDYLVLPRVLGHAVGLSPLLVLVSVLATAILFGGFAVLLAIPIAAVLATLVDVAVRGKDPAEEAKRAGDPVRSPVDAMVTLPLLPIVLLLRRRGLLPWTITAVARPWGRRGPATVLRYHVRGEDEADAALEHLVTRLQAGDGAPVLPGAERLT